MATTTINRKPRSKNRIRKSEFDRLVEVAQERKIGRYVVEGDLHSGKIRLIVGENTTENEDLKELL